MSNPELSLVLRPIEPTDNRAMAEIIRTVMTEFGAVGPGFSIQDPEVDYLYENYQDPSATYWVISGTDQLWGGGGIAPLEGGDPGICELKKMYFLPALRGKGFGWQLLQQLLAAAQQRHYTHCYLETLKHMEAAGRLYQKAGFQRLSGNWGHTGHGGCDAFYALDLRQWHPAT